MADRFDWYYEQLVLEDELDSAFNALEVSDRAMADDWSMRRDASNEAEFGGIFWGLTATNLLSGLDMRVEDGAGYDDDGRRVGQSTEAGYIVVTPSATGSTSVGQGGVPTGGTSTSPDPGYERWVTIFIVYDRLLSDPRYDGYNVLVYFDRAESFHYEVSMGTQKTIGTLLVSDKPARQDNKLLVADCRIKNVGGTVTYVIDSTSNDRREVFFNVTASGSPGKVIKAENVRLALKAQLQLYNDHVGGTADKHPSADITYPGGKTWADGTGGLTGAATNLKAGIDGIVDDLKSTVEVAGAKRLGAKTQAGSLTTPSQASPLSLPTGTLEAQLTAIMNAVNGRVFRGGDNGIAGALSPSVNGTALGTDALSWDGYMRDFKAKGAVKSHLIPDSTSRNLGSAPSPWGTVFANAYYGPYIEVTDTLFQNLQVDNDAHVDGSLTVADSASVGDLTSVGDVLFKPHGGSPFHAKITWEASQLVQPNYELFCLKGYKPSGSYKHEMSRMDACGFRWERGFQDGFQGYRRNANLLTTGGLPNAGYVGSGAQIYRHKYPYEGLNLYSGGTFGDTAYLGGPGNASPGEELLLHFSIIPYTVTDTTLIVCATGEADTLLPSFQPGFDDFIGIGFTPTLGAFWHILISDKTGGHAELNTGISVALGSTCNCYLFWDGDTNLYWWIGSGAWNTWAPGAGKAHADGFRLYAQVTNAGSSSKQLTLLHWGMFSQAYALP